MIYIYVYNEIADDIYIYVYNEIADDIYICVYNEIADASAFTTALAISL